MSSGTFYAGVFMPAESGDDSLYFGLDVNRIGGNHAYYNVLAAWNPSSIQGAIMMRPLLGQSVTSSHVKETATTKNEHWHISPNPANNEIEFHFPGDVIANFRITNMQGQTVMNGKVANDQQTDISNLPAGMYLVNIMVEGVAAAPQKLIKL